jgi:hypothetical protein
MNWIKKRYDQFFLVLAAVALLVVCGLIALRAKSFPDNFADARTNIVPSKKIPDLDLTAIKAAEAAANEPAKWQPANDANSYLFVSDKYAIDPASGQPKKPIIGTNNRDSLTGKDIPNKFFIDNNLAALDPAVPKQDPDKDGYTNEDEWRGTRDPSDPTIWHDSTDPNDPKSHPPLITKLFLKKWIRVPFRLLFQAYDGDPTKPSEMSFQINAIDRGRKTEFLKIGEKVSNSDYRIEKFEFKEQVSPSTGEKTDVSELTMLNTSTNDSIVVVKEKITDSPDSYALFELAGKDLKAVKKLQSFDLPPEPGLYKLVDIKEGQAVIQPPAGGPYIVVPDPRKK